MSNRIFNKAGIVTLAAAGVMLVAVANGASAHGFGGGNWGHGGFNGGGMHNDHIVVRGGRDNDRGGGFDRGVRDPGDEYNRRKNGNTGVYCPSCKAPLQIGNRPSGSTRGESPNPVPLPRPQTRPTTPGGGSVHPTSSSPELPPGTSSRVVGPSSPNGTGDNADHAPRDIGHPHTVPDSSNL